MFFPEMVTYKRYSDKTMYFRIEDEKIFVKKLAIH